MPRPRSPLLLLLSLPLMAVAPFMLVAFGTRRIVPRLGDAIARKMSAAASLAQFAVHVPEVPEAPEPSSEAPVDPPAPLLPRATARGARGKASISPLVVLIPEARVRRLTARQLRAVHWTAVVGPEGHAAGVRLSGVGALGVGLDEGDVVTSINGRPTPTEDEAAAAGAAAWASPLRPARVTIVRGAETLAVTVELPAQREVPDGN